jgi:hypothetical protein
MILNAKPTMFAIELLLPRGCSRIASGGRRLIDLGFIVTLATDANVSLQATAIRVVRETSDRICVCSSRRV